MYQIRFFTGLDNKYFFWLCADEDSCKKLVSEILAKFNDSIFVELAADSLNPLTHFVNSSQVFLISYAKVEERKEEDTSPPNCC